MGILLALLLAAGLGRGNAMAQAVWQADIRIQTLGVVPLSDRTLSVRILVASDNDDPAQQSRLELLLPIGVSVLRLTPPCRPSPAAVANTAGRITCDLGDIPVRGLREINVITTAPIGHGARFAAFVLSDTPDPFPTNNYAERSVP